MHGYAASKNKLVSKWKKSEGDVCGGIPSRHKQIKVAYVQKNGITETEIQMRDPVMLEGNKTYML